MPRSRMHGMTWAVVALGAAFTIASGWIVIDVSRALAAVRAEVARIGDLREWRAIGEAVAAGMEPPGRLEGAVPAAPARVLDAASWRQALAATERLAAASRASATIHERLGAERQLEVAIDAMILDARERQQIRSEHLARRWTLLVVMLAVASLAAVALGVLLIRHRRVARELAAALRDRLDQESRLKLMLDRMPAVLWSVDRDLVFTSSRGAGLAALGASPDETIGRSAVDYFGAQEADFAPLVAMRRALDGEATEYELEWQGRIFLTRVEPLRDERDRPIGAVGLSTDLTEERRQAEDLRDRVEREGLLFRELDHRVGNNLAALGTLIEIGRRTAQDVEAFADSVGGRVHAMARAHALLSGRGDGAVPFATLLAELVPPGLANRLRRAGPEAMIAARQAPAFAMVLQELFTNAVKHGALGDEGGIVRVVWRLESRPSGDPRLRWRWSERGAGGVALPIREGAGLGLVRGLVRHELGGVLALRFDERGARYDFVGTLDPVPGSGGGRISKRSGGGSRATRDSKRARKASTLMPQVAANLASS